MDSNSLSTRVKQIIDTASFNGVEIVVHNQIGVLNKYLPYCVLGVLCTKEGLKIDKYLLSSLLFRYRVICVRQCPPGVLTEYPALRIAQRLSMECNIPVLYLHTKGAYNKHPTQSRIVNMWIDEFVRKKSL